MGHLGGYSSLREIAARESGIVEVRYWGEHVFRGVVTPSLTLVLDKEARGVQTTIFSKDAAEQQGDLIAGQPWNFSPAAELIERLRADSFSLGKLVGDCGIRSTAAKEQVVPLSEAKGKFVAALEGKVVNRYSCNTPEIAVRLNTKKELFVSNFGAPSGLKLGYGRGCSLRCAPAWTPKSVLASLCADGGSTTGVFCVCELMRCYSGHAVGFGCVECIE